MFKPMKTITPIKAVKEAASSVTPKKKRVAAYARVSTDYEDQLNSYKTQCDEYTKLITSNPNYVFAGLFADQGLSGTQAKKRPEFMKMITKAKNGEIDLTLTKSISRFGRNTVDVISYIRELRNLSVEICFEKENISSLDPKIDFMLTILSSVAQEESRAISSNVKWTIEKKAKNGIVDPRRIYGYDVIDSKFVANESESEVIKDLFTLALKGYNINDIVKTLNTKGILTMKGSTWKYGTVRHILQNEKYCGDALLRKTVCIDYLTKKTVKNDNIVDKYYVSNNHPPIISKQLFEDVQMLIDHPSKHMRNANKTSKYPLTGILYCPKCGRTLKRQQITSGIKKHVILNCNHSYNNPFICKSGSPRYDLVYGAALESVYELLSNKELLNHIFEAFDKPHQLDDLRTEQSNIKTKIAHQNESLDQCPTAASLVDQILTQKEYLREIIYQISLAVSANSKLGYLKTLSSLEFNDDDIKFKEIYSIIISDEQKVIFVISPHKSTYVLSREIPKIMDTEPILSNMHLSKDEKYGIFYAVICYE